MTGGRNTTGAAVSKARVRKATTRKTRGRKSLLNLTTVIETPFITINGENYDLVTRETADIILMHQMQEASTAFGENNDIKKAVADKDWAAARDIQGRIIEAQNDLVSLMVPTLPTDVLARLSMAHKSAIISAFTGTVSRQTPGTPSPESPPTGENGSQGSTASTEPETPGSG